MLHCTPLVAQRQRDRQTQIGESSLPLYTGGSRRRYSLHRSPRGCHYTVICQVSRDFKPAGAFDGLTLGKLHPSQTMLLQKARARGRQYNKMSVRKRVTRDSPTMNNCKIRSVKPRWFKRPLPIIHPRNSPWEQTDEVSSALDKTVQLSCLSGV